MNKSDFQNIFSPQPDQPILGSLYATGAVVSFLLSLYIPFIKIFPNFSLSLSLALGFLCVVLVVLLAFLIRNYQAVERTTQCQFRYVNGVLLNGNQPNIALRIVTFHEMLENIAEAVTLNEINKQLVFLKNGRNAGSRFGKDFKENIYPHITKNNKPFEQLSETEILKQWTDYDSATGWGLISAKKEGLNLCITAKHLALFAQERDGGKWFSAIMAGYAESVVNEILAEYNVEYVFSGEINTDSRKGTISFLLKPTETQIQFVNHLPRTLG
jgi:hypothetical protein